MSLKTRLKAALTAFVNPPTAPKLVVTKPATEPSVVIDNQLLAGKNVLITGAARNIGRSIALEMAKQGANIFFTDLVREGCENLEKELRCYPVKSRAFVSDIS
ncbi:MAG TPA: SDR family NAD(P)-dependent oxidoreductase, partial [Phormidium sp.]